MGIKETIVNNPFKSVVGTGLVATAISGLGGFAMGGGKVEAPTPIVTTYTGVPNVTVEISKDAFGTIPAATSPATTTIIKEVQVPGQTVTITKEVQVPGPTVYLPGQTVIKEVPGPTVYIPVAPANPVITVPGTPVETTPSQIKTIGFANNEIKIVSRGTVIAGDVNLSLANGLVPVFTDDDPTTGLIVLVSDQEVIQAPWGASGKTGFNNLAEMQTEADQSAKSTFSNRPEMRFIIVREVKNGQVIAERTIWR